MEAPDKESFTEITLAIGGIHIWFEGRGPQCILLVDIDDAMSSYNKSFTLRSASVKRTQILSLRLIRDRYYQLTRCATLV